MIIINIYLIKKTAAVLSGSRITEDRRNNYEK